MKSFVLFLALVCAAALSSSWAPSVTKAAGNVKSDRAVMRFIEPVTVMGVTLKGDYLFVHNDEAMARGEACTYIYKGELADSAKLVVSFHCIPATREKVGYFTVRTAMTGPGQYDLKEFQYPGSTEAHLVPAK
jgi:hypothetical protein